MRILVRDETEYVRRIAHVTVLIIVIPVTSSKSLQACTAFKKAISVIPMPLRHYCLCLYCTMLSMSQGFWYLSPIYA